MRAACIIVLLIISLHGYSQKNFEGSILYNSYGGSGDSLSYEIIFGKSKMKATWWAIKDAKKELRGYQIYDFEKDIAYRVMPGQELVEADSLYKQGTGSGLKKIDEKKNIAGYACYKYIDKKEPAKGDIVTTVIWQSDELFYIVPERIRNKHTLSASESGNILFLQLDLTIHLGEVMGQKKESANRIEAAQIRSYAVPDSVFSIPASYKIIFEAITNDELIVEDIRIEEEEPPPPPPPPTPPKVKTRKQ